MAELQRRFVKGAQVRAAAGGPAMIVDVASAKLAICHWVVDGRKNEGVFDVRSLEWYRTGQQYDLWPDLTHPYQLVAPAN